MAAAVFKLSYYHRYSSISSSSSRQNVLLNITTTSGLNKFYARTGRAQSKWLCVMMITNAQNEDTRIYRNCLQAIKRAVALV